MQLKVARCILVLRRGSDQIGQGRRWLTALLVLAALVPVASAADMPNRVVSMNLCTDQLAMMIAAEGQLISVSYLARDPRASAMAKEAQSFEVNHGLAEEIYLMQPDLVIAGAFTTRATVSMLERLGVPVVTFQPAYRLDDISTRIRQMGEALHQTDKADTMADAFEGTLTRLRDAVTDTPRAVLYYANGYTSGDQTLAGEILAAAGFANAAAEAGYTRGMKLPLEVLAVTAPDIVITSRPYPGASKAEEILDHPVVTQLRTDRASATMIDHDWICGTPHVLRAIEALSGSRQAMTEVRP